MFPRGRRRRCYAPQRYVHRDVYTATVATAAPNPVFFFSYLFFVTIRFVRGVFRRAVYGFFFQIPNRCQDVQFFFQSVNRKPLFQSKKKNFEKKKHRGTFLFRTFFFSRLLIFVCRDNKCYVVYLLRLYNFARLSGEKKKTRKFTVVNKLLFLWK